MSAACAGASALGYALEPLFSYRVRLGAPQWIGEGADGLRVFYPVAEGTVGGPRLRGRIAPGGGDWLCVRRDGVQLLDVRAVVETEDGARVLAAYTGVGELGEGGYERFLRRELPPAIALRAAGRLHAADPQHRWLNRLQCLFVGEADTRRAELRYDVYAVV